MKLTGTIAEIGNVESSGNFQKREILIYQFGSEIDVLKCQITNNNYSLLKGFKVGDNVEVSFELSGRRWESPNNGKVYMFTTINIIDIRKEKQVIQVVEPNAESFVDNLPF